MEIIAVLVVVGAAAALFLRARSRAGKPLRIRLAPVVERAAVPPYGLLSTIVAAVPPVPAGSRLPAPVRELAPFVAAPEPEQYAPAPTGAFGTALSTGDGKITMRDPDDDGEFQFRSTMSPDAIAITDVPDGPYSADDDMTIAPPVSPDTPLRWREDAE